jgi:hypothetical protein
MNLKKLRDDAEAADSRLSAAMYQVGLVREELRSRHIPIDDDYDPDSDVEPKDDLFAIIHNAFHCQHP